MDVQAPELKVAGRRVTGFAVGMLLIVGFAVLLRLQGIHDPILDHPNWRQGDTASIARNFARLNYSIMAPQTNYDGPPPNYVELELQIVPFVAATLYKFFGVHEIFGRLLTLAFSVGTVFALGLFGRWLFSSWAAGLVAAFVFAVVPGSIYYGRTFTPDAAMVFFLTAGLYACARLIVEDEALKPRPLARSTALIAFAYLAKPVALVGILPLCAMVWERARAGRTMRPTAIAVLLFVPVAIVYLYGRRVAEHAEWHWASGIATLHVFPALQSALTTGPGFVLKALQFKDVLGMLVHTMLGPIPSLLAIAGICALPWVAARTTTLLWGWLAGGLLYTYVVVTVERVDYYMFLLLPLGALLIAGLVSLLLRALAQRPALPALRWATAAVALLLAAVTVQQSRAAIAPYYRYNKQVYRNAIALSQTLDPSALVVMGHYGPDVLYYMDRYGWEEDPLAWTPFDEESAIAKGARAYVSIEDNRLRKNLELCAWLQRFPLVNTQAQWPVYITDPARIEPGAIAFWQAFRKAEAAGGGRQYLDAHHVCALAGLGQR
ncbi:MAG TPA: glycosyltransferase family 39 protein [Verrucomicrobiae bacterium]|nr:glycosyltransferase family 39 protein [Verrucomicrobiae bacterium]